MKPWVDVYLKILVMFKPVKKDGSRDIQSSYKVLDIKPSSGFDPAKMGEVSFHFHNDFVFQQENEFYKLDPLKQEEIKLQCAKSVEDNFIQFYPKKSIKPVIH
ncbi:MAG: hypothetical protein KF802_02255 [Bdellovibrionaceae bacterium]|nr:hypothetical protein [Pseudobdellovibrionaceae bacterium]